MSTCKSCGWQPDQGLSRGRQLAEIGQHCREQHSEMMARRMRAGRARRQKVVVQQDEHGNPLLIKQGKQLIVPTRLTVQTVELPQELFLFYHWCRRISPEYEATQSEWLQQVVATWAIDHGHEIGLPRLPYDVIDRALGMAQTGADDGDNRDGDQLDS